MRMKSLAYALGLAALLAIAATSLYRSSSPRAHPQGSSPTPRSRKAAPSERTPLGLSEESLVHLEEWLRGASVSRRLRGPLRDIFQQGEAPRPRESLPKPTVVPVAESPPLILKGFVYEGSGTLAAIRYEERMWLVQRGDRLGSYRVEELVPPEQVRLVEVENGEVLVLRLTGGR